MISKKTRSFYLTKAGYIAMTLALLSLPGCGWFESSSQQHASVSAHHQTAAQGQTISLAEVLAQQVKNTADPLTLRKTTYIYANDPDYERKRRAWSVIDQGIRSAHQDTSSSSASMAIGETRGQFILAAAAQQTGPSVEAALARAARASATATPEKKQAIEALTIEVTDLYRDMQAAESDMAQSMGLSSADNMTLVPVSLSVGPDPLPPIDIQITDLEILALHARTEMQHAASVTQNDILSLRDRTMNAFPGIGSILTRNATGQIDLDDDEWTRFSESLTQSLTRLFTLPLSLQNPDTRAKMAALQEQALSAAIMAQVHVAYDDYTKSLQDLNALKRTDEITLSGNGADDRAIADLNVLYKTLRMHRAAADLNIAYARLLDTLGVSIVPDGAEKMDSATLTATLENSLTLTAPDRIHEIILAATQGSVYQPPIIIANGTKTQSIQDTNIVTAAYQVNDESGIVPVSFTNPFMKLRIPLPQKISFRDTGNHIRIGENAAESEAFHMDKTSIRKLLDSPITEP